jgi:protein phosphatase
MIEHEPLRIGKRSDVGKERELNEDSLGTPGTFNLSWARQKERGSLLAVADGVGRHAAGEAASQTAIQVLFDTYYSGSERDPARALEASLAEANKRVRELATSDVEKHSMGTTLVAAVRQGTRLFVANVRDSRAYLIRGSKMRQLTHDHSWVGEQVRARLLTEDQAEKHAFKNIVTRAICL